MSFGAKKEDVKDFQPGAFVTYGVHELKINDIIVEKSSQKGTPRVKFIVETKPVTEAGFTPDPSATVGGKVGNVFSEYLHNDDKEAEFSQNMLRIAKHIGSAEEEALDGYTADTLEQYIEKVKKVICNKYTFFKVVGEEYLKADGKIGVSLRFARFKFVDKDPANLSFDKNNKYDFKKLEVKPDAEPELPDYTEKEVSDLKF